MTKPVTLAPEAVEAVAVRVVELLRDEGHGGAPAGLVDAAQLAALLGLSRATVYEHADELQAIRVGDGPRGRLRFDADAALTAWQHRHPRVEPEPQPTTPRRRTTRQGDTPLLPVHGTTEETQHGRPPNPQRRHRER